MQVSGFMANILNELIDKKDITEGTATKYVKNLFILNNKQPFKNLAFLKKTDDINNILDKYADSSKSNMLASVLAVLNLFKDKKIYQKLTRYYVDLFNGNKTELDKNQKKNVKTDKQQENWVSWEEIDNIKNSLKEQVFSYKKTLTPEQFNKVLDLFILSLYTDLPPRRNMDYQICYIIKEYNESFSNDKNYCDITNNEFIFNMYKTRRRYGQQRVKFGNNKDFMEIFEKYIQYHPLYNKKIGKTTEYPLLVNAYGTHLTALNGITRILNRIFKKKVSSSMLRHIYLTNKYGDELEEMKNDSELMAHSLQTQQNYIVNKDNEEPILKVKKTKRKLKIKE
jgi:integrase